MIHWLDINIILIFSSMLPDIVMLAISTIAELISQAYDNFGESF